MRTPWRVIRCLFRFLPLSTRRGDPGHHLKGQSLVVSTPSLLFSFSLSFSFSLLSSFEAYFSLSLPNSVPRICTLDYRAALLRPAPPIAAPKKLQAPRMSHHQQTHVAVFEVMAKHNAAGVKAQPIRTRDAFRSHRIPRTGPMPFFGFDDPRPFYSDEEEEEEEEEDFAFAYAQDDDWLEETEIEEDSDL